jgi:serine/threonine protein kinase
MHHPIS